MLYKNVCFPEYFSKRRSEQTASSTTMMKLRLSVTTMFMLFNVHGSVHCSNILIFIQQDAMLNSLFYLETALHVSGDTITYH